MKNANQVVAVHYYCTGCGNAVVEPVEGAITICGAKLCGKCGGQMRQQLIWQHCEIVKGYLNGDGK